jgi:hypothetical protein
MKVDRIDDVRGALHRYVEADDALRYFLRTKCKDAASQKMTLEIGNMHTSALRRASMDLTRALARLRAPG